ncbi:MAG: FecR domain-containing protein [Elusimicrobiota bacterium]|jgi:hypothetical protein
MLKNSSPQRLLGLMLLAFGLPAASGLGAQESSWDARLTQVEGEVTVYSQDEKDGLPGQTEMPLESGDRIVIGANSRAELALDDQSIVELGPRSTFTLESLREDETRFFLELGSLSAKIRSLLSGRVLRVRTPTAVAAVRGTEFAVESEEGRTHVGVFDEGRVSVSGTDDGEAVELSSNQETQVLRGRAPARAAAMRRLLRMRANIGRLRARRETLRRTWKALPQAERLRLRRALLEKRRATLREGPGRRPTAGQKSSPQPALRERMQDQRQNSRRRRIDRRRRQ